jgi:hypothetical protein
MTNPATSWLDDLEAAIDWMKYTGFAVQIEGHDIVHITDIDQDTGAATIRVFTSTHPDAAVLFEGVINVRERGTPEPAS